MRGSVIGKFVMRNMHVRRKAMDGSMNEELEKAIVAYELEKQKCSPGQHQHEGIVGCHPVSQKHRGEGQEVDKMRSVKKFNKGDVIWQEGRLRQVASSTIYAVVDESGKLAITKHPTTGKPTQHIFKNRYTAEMEAEYLNRRSQ